MTAAMQSADALHVELILACTPELFTGMNVSVLCLCACSVFSVEQHAAPVIMSMLALAATYCTFHSILVNSIRTMRLT